MKTDRKKLREYLGETITATGEFGGFKSSDDIFCLVTNIRLEETNELLTDHLWFETEKGFSDLRPLCKGEIVRITGIVENYTKGYVSDGFYNWELDYEKPLTESCTISPQKVTCIKRIEGGR